MTVSNHTPETPLKQCSRCKQYKPATHDYFDFYKRSKDGLRNPCKSCRAEIYTLTSGTTKGTRKQSNKWLAVIGLRLCSSCGQIKLIEDFNKWKQHYSGLASQCRQCHVSNPDPEKAKIWVEKNREKVRSIKARWKVRNPEKVRADGSRRRARKRQLPATFTEKDWQVALDFFNGLCAYCGRQQSFWNDMQQDHIIPVAKGGGYTPDNIVPACMECNCSKNNNDLPDWLVKKFGKRRAAKIQAAIDAYLDHLSQ